METIRYTGNRRVLVVEDDKLVRELIIEIMESADYDTDGAGGGNEALTKLDGPESYSMIISDIGMEGMDGLELYEEVAKRSKRLSKSLLFVTGTVTVRTEMFIAEKGVARLTKPFNTLDLISAVVRMEADNIRKG